MRWLALAVLAGCYQPHADPSCALSCTAAVGCPDGLPCIAGRCGDGCAPDDAKIDSPHDRDIDAPDDCYGGGDLIVCGVQIGSGTMILNGVDTDSDVRCQHVVIGTTPACVIANANIELDGGVNAGGRMLVILGDMITVPSGVGVSVSAGGKISAPGARVCAGGSGASSGNVGAGGAGGAFVTSGGAGGAGGGAVPSVSNPIAPGAFGGCAGGRGGGDSGGSGGGAGGAIALIATQMIKLEGGILACGAGGLEGVVGGGGGGGSGGSIILIAPSVTGTSARLLAVGGGGGGGGDGVDSSLAGNECDITGVAHGGLAGMGGGNGGDGYDPPSTYGRAGSAGDTGGGGGGGGGGGRGRIEVRSPNIALTQPIILPPL